MPRTLVAHNVFGVGWICALATELVAVCELLDEEYIVDNLDYQNDANIYVFGRIGRHNIVISCLPKGRYGLTSAASVARDMLRSFPSIRFGLTVGIGGGAPSKRHDIRLGDVVVGCPTSASGGVMNYQYGKSIQGRQFARTGVLTPPPRVLLSALNNLIARHERNGHKIQDTINRITSNPRLTAKYQYPGRQYDNLFNSEYVHQKDEEDCEACCMRDGVNIRRRSPRSAELDDPVIHYGLIASADSLMKDAERRDKLAKEADVLCFEMEAAGLMDHFPCLVIRGISNYCDTHKNKRWEGYAAAAAAAYAKELLDIIPTGEGPQASVHSPIQYKGLVAITPLIAGTKLLMNDQEATEA
jgi:nucleoside phosphorylase